MARNDSCDTLISKWTSLSIKKAGGIVQEIIIPEFGIRKVGSQPTHLIDGDQPTIFVTMESYSSRLITHLVSHHLAEIFGVPTLQSEIALILDTHAAEENLWHLLRIPELPSMWTAALEALCPAPRLMSDNIPSARPAGEGVIETVMSVEEAKDIMSFVRASEDASELSLADQDLGGLQVDGLSSSLSFPLSQTFIEDEEEAEITQGNIRSGFAGEFFVGPC